MTLTGNYTEHKEYVTAKMEKRCLALAAEDSIPRGELRELAVTSGIVSILVVYISRLTPVKILFRLRLQKIYPGVILLMFLRVLTTV
jgi:hypothetical protein